MPEKQLSQTIRLNGLNKFHTGERDKWISQGVGEGGGG